MTPPGIKPATFRFVAQHLNHRATAVGVSWARETANNKQLRWSFPPTSSVALTYFRFKQFHAGQRTRPTSGPRSCLCLLRVMKMVLLAEEDKFLLISNYYYHY